jgi:hypothetical protein
MWTVIKQAMVNAISLQYKGIPPINLAKILIGVTLRQEVTLLAD